MTCGTHTPCTCFYPPILRNPTKPEQATHRGSFFSSSCGEEVGGGVPGAILARSRNLEVQDALKNRVVSPTPSSCLARRGGTSGMKAFPFFTGVGKVLFENNIRFPSPPSFFGLWAGFARTSAAHQTGASCFFTHGHWSGNANILRI